MRRETTEKRGTRPGDEPLLYRITVRGVVPQSWLDRLAGLRISTSSPKRSVLEGPIADPSALAGVLDTLCQLGLPILEVKALTKARGARR